MMGFFAAGVFDTAHTPHGDGNGVQNAETVNALSDTAHTPHGDGNNAPHENAPNGGDTARAPHGDGNACPL